mmetsp:Transcript_85519/g.250368  ORF Transcript_85519/g.250368 Transcript_85519/m.250368 type:complete len:389 (-) Transcript_85519:442-1608(-)
MLREVFPWRQVVSSVHFYQDVACHDSAHHVEDAGGNPGDMHCSPRPRVAVVDHRHELPRRRRPQRLAEPELQQLQPYGRGQGDRLGVKSPLRAQQLVHVLDIAHLRRGLYPLHLVPAQEMVCIRPAHGKVIQRIFGVLSLTGVEEPRAAEGASAALPSPAVHSQDVVSVTAHPHLGKFEELHHLLEPRGRVVLHVETFNHTSSEVSDRIRELRAHVHDLVVPSVEGLEEAHHLVQWVSVEPHSHPSSWDAHANEPGCDVHQVQVEVPLNVHKSPLVLSGDPSQRRAQAPREHAEPDPPHDARNLHEPQEAVALALVRLRGHAKLHERFNVDRESHDECVDDIPELQEEDTRAEDVDPNPYVQDEHDCDQDGHHVLEDVRAIPADHRGQ